MSKQTKHDHEIRPGDQASGPAAQAPEAAAECADHLEAAQDANEACRDRVQRDTVALAEKDARIAELEGELAGLKDQYLRKLADYENFRKRMFREKEDAVQYANSQILADLVEVLDNFDRAIKSSELSKDFQMLHDGVDMIRRGLLSTLEGKYGLARFESVGKPFDPHMHEALMSEQGDCGEPTVSEEFVAGYRLRDRVLRSAKVKVRMPAPANQESSAQGAEPAGSAAD